MLLITLLLKEHLILLHFPCIFLTLLLLYLFPLPLPLILTHHVLEEYNADSEDNDNYKEEIYKDNDSDEDSGDENPDKIYIHNYNNSFAEYGQFIDLTNLDKANPQFDEIISPDDLNQ